MVFSGNCRECHAPAATAAVADTPSAVAMIAIQHANHVAGGGDEGYTGTPTQQELLKLQVKLQLQRAHDANADIPEELLML